MITYLVDSNIFLRYILPEKTKLHEQATAFFAGAQHKKHKLFFDDVTIAEIVWVLKSVYQKNSKEISTLISPIIEHDGILLNDKKLILQTIAYFSTHNLSYIDCYLHCLSQSKNIPLATFDTKLSKIK